VEVIVENIEGDPSLLKDGPVILAPPPPTVTDILPETDNPLPVLKPPAPPPPS
jgi:hypothetical protein